MKLKVNQKIRKVKSRKFFTTERSRATKTVLEKI